MHYHLQSKVDGVVFSTTVLPVSQCSSASPATSQSPQHPPSVAFTQPWAPQSPASRNVLVRVSTYEYTSTDQEEKRNHRCRIAECCCFLLFLIQETSTTLKKLSAFFKNNSFRVTAQVLYLQAENGLDCLITTEIAKKPRQQNEKVA